MKKYLLTLALIAGTTLGTFSLRADIYKITGVRSDDETTWKTYTKDLIIFSTCGFALVFLLQLLQSHLPLNPFKLPAVSWHSAFNTSVSFMTNTNWQSYAGETTLSYLVQMLGLTAQNFVSAATGIAVLLALIRGISRKTTDKLGSFWVDLTRSVLYVLLPLSILLSIVLVGQGTIQNFKSYEKSVTLEGSQQVLPMGPVTSQIAIKQLGTNGGVFLMQTALIPLRIQLL